MHLLTLRIQVLTDSCLTRGFGRLHNVCTDEDAGIMVAPKQQKDTSHLVAQEHVCPLSTDCFSQLCHVCRGQSISKEENG